MEQNIESIRVTGGRGNAYTHLLSNGLEILRRFASVTSVVQQKKMITLMCKLIDSNIVHGYKVLDTWINRLRLLMILCNTFIR